MSCSAAIVVGPAIYRWYEIVPFSLGSLVCMIVEFFGLCLFSLALSALFGWLLSLVSSKMRKKALVETLMSFVFLGAYLYGYSQLNTIVANLVANTADIAASVGDVLPLYWIVPDIAAVDEYQNGGNENEHNSETVIDDAGGA